MPTPWRWRETRIACTQLPDRELVAAAAVLAKGVASVIEGAGLRTQRAAALELIDSAGRALGAELRRRHFHAVR
jgi:hypothetical protein